LKLLRHRDIPEEKYSNAFLGFGPEESNFVVELTYSISLSKPDPTLVFFFFFLNSLVIYGWLVGEW
jgi:lactoylglutathione lyase